MNDLKTLHDAWGAPTAPSPAARERARAALLARAARRRRSPLGPRLAAVAVAGLMAAAFLLVVQNLGDRPPAVPVAAAQVLERAAAAAERKPFTPPRPHQWIYTEDRLTSSDGGAPEVQRMWRRVDGRGLAWLENGKLELRAIEVPRGPERKRVEPFDSYASLTKLPTDPDALLRWAYTQAESITGAGLTEHGDVYAIFNGIMRGNVLPPALEAGMFRALKQVPGVTLRTVELNGRSLLALGQTEDWLHEELLLDPETYAYRGERGIVTHDATIDPAKAGNATGRIEKGHTVTAERLRTAIVDHPGDGR